MTTVTGYARRPVSLDLFADITDAAMTIGTANGRYLLTFDADLTADQQAQVKARLESRNDTEATLRQQAKAAHDVDQTFITTTVPLLLSGADSIIKDAAATSREVALAKGIKALVNQCESLSRQVIGIGRIILADIEGEA